MKKAAQKWFAKSVLRAGALEAAPRLLGAVLRHETREGVRTARIVEVEAYTQDDPASHCFRGRTARNAPMFGEPGLAYVYFSYGMHHCVNVVCAPAGRGEAVLIRAVEPMEGVELMIEARGWGTRPLRLMTSGPGKVCAAMGIGPEHNGCLLLDGGGLELLCGDPVLERLIATSRRIGISKAADKPWRFYVRDSPFVSALKKSRDSS